MAQRLITIDIAVFDGVDELDAVGPLEVLRRAARAGSPFEVRLVTAGKRLEVTGASGLRLRADAPAGYPPRVLVMPGGGWVLRSDTGAWGEAQRGTWVDVVRATAKTGSLLAGVCTGTMILAGAGIVGSRRAATHHAARADLEASGATVLGDRVVDDGDLVTSGGVTSGIDLALWLVERLAGRDLADQVAEDLEYLRFRPAPPR
ncbi:MAG TPA: DJ-1/PfpI family protein [Actinomycetota bacterium]|nr:DJ-1/PfpI family protein [Actinomycetota bacterium]